MSAVQAPRSISLRPSVVPYSLDVVPAAQARGRECIMTPRSGSRLKDAIVQLVLGSWSVVVRHRQGVGSNTSHAGTEVGVVGFHV